MANIPSAPDLRPRKQPTQQRAKQRVDRILNATATLLDEVGLDGLTTNLIAERAGVKVASLYQYFPNKYAVLSTLAERMFTEQQRQLEKFLTPSGFALPWPEAIDGMIDALIAGRFAQPGGMALRSALAAVPELAAARERDRQAVSNRVARALRQAGARVSERRLQAIARSLFDTAVAILDQAMRSDETRAAELIAELKVMHRSYLENYIQ